MTTKEFVLLEKRLLPSFPGFAVKGRLMFIPPVEHTLRGFNFEPSGFNKKALYITSFFLPLCVPKKYLSYEFGNRLKGTGWRADMADLETVLTAAMQKEVPFLNSLQTPSDVLEAIKLRVRDSKNPYHHEAAAYVLARIGEVSEAVAALDRLLQLLDLNVGWQRDMADRARALKSQLVSDPAAAQKQLDVWEAETAKNLGLEEFR